MCNNCSCKAVLNKDEARCNTPEEMVEVCQAIKEGKKLEYRSIPAPGRIGMFRRDWTEMIGTRVRPQFAVTQYRVKREPRTLFARQLHESNITDVAFDEAAIDHILQHYPSVKAKKLKFVEVLDN